MGTGKREDQEYIKSIARDGVPPEFLDKVADSLPNEPTDKDYTDSIDKLSRRCGVLTDKDLADGTDYHKILIILDSCEVSFKGRYLRDRETDQWHYYLTEEGSLIHVRKDKMVAVIDNPEISLIEISARG